MPDMLLPCRSRREGGARGGPAIMHNFKSRAGAVVAGAAVLAAVGGVGGAAAAGQIGSLQIRDHSIRSIDVRKGAIQSPGILNGTVQKVDLAKSLQAVLGVPGA